MTKHTPGPWHVGMRPGPIIYGTKGDQVADLRGFLDIDETSANARLIAAAPDLLDAMQSMVDAYQTHFDVMPVAWQTYDSIARAALAKARGE